eukprot:TRINITY_DN13490_c0_g5_i1.p1 TRINITY_DN13490_c0_g5~~TRINITY_DN13490_c0_g5_i1.p1  ORF type:complete len:305 (+),score=51.39 TRINITY_DN13490_c0_g5_i1:268-1182(+)
MADRLPTHGGDFASKYTTGAILGKGSFAVVQAATAQTSNEKFAVKIVDVRRRDIGGNHLDKVDDFRKEMMERETRLWLKACSSKCTNIVALHEGFDEHPLRYLVSERCNGRLMDTLLERDKFLNCQLFWKICRHMFKACAHIHDIGVVHRDINPDNFLWGGTDSGTLKLCDFGFAQEVTPFCPICGVFGTPLYMAPEMLDEDEAGYAFSVDVWSVGAVIYLLLFDRFPYLKPERGAKAIKSAIRDDEPPLEIPCEADIKINLSEEGSDEAIRLVKGLLTRNVSDRVDVAASLDVPWTFLAEIDD